VGLLPKRLGKLPKRQKLIWSGITPQKAKHLTGVGLLPKRQKLNWSGNTPQKTKLKLEWDYSPKGKN
jgi:hypothetical protein